MQTLHTKASNICLFPFVSKGPYTHPCTQTETKPAYNLGVCAQLQWVNRVNGALIINKRLFQMLELS